MARTALMLAAMLLSLSQADTSPWYWATTVITETVWTFCGADTSVSTPGALGCGATLPSQAPEQGPITTDIVLDGVSLVSITVQPVSSPTSCYSLPVPASSLKAIAFSADQSDDPPIYLYLGDNETTPAYIGTVIDGEGAFLDLSSNTSAAGNIVLTLSTGESLVFDAHGLHHFNADCDSASSVVITNFLDQIGSMHTNLTSPLVQRDVSPGTNFTVTIQVDDLVDSQLQWPQLAFGSSTCDFISRQSSNTWDNLTWTCNYPGANSSVVACQRSFRTWLPHSRFVPAKLITNLPPFLSQFSAPLGSLIPNLSQPLQQGMAWIETAQKAALMASEKGGDMVCDVLHALDQYEILFSDPGLGPVPKTIGVYRSPPVPTIVGRVASRTPRMTQEPPRQIVPTVTGFSSVTATSFGVLGGITGFVGSVFGGAKSTGVVVVKGAG
ncbi:hypothetical protein OQA88_7635 [Cercophora sp. LCS_1]